MKNPWKELIDKVDNNYLLDDNHYIIESDLKVIERFNKSFRNEKTKDKFEIHFQIHPSHYTGNVKKAKVLLLATNPGFVENEIDTLYKLSAFHKEMIQNLNFENNTFINLDKERIEQGNYWQQKTKQLRIDVGNDDLIYEKMALIQFFPYHSKKFRKIAKKYFENGEKYLKTQLFAFELIKNAIKDGKIIIILRSKKEWYRAIPELKEYKEKGFVFEISNYRQPYITAKNLKSEKKYNLLIDKLKE